MANKEIPYKIYLEESELASAWYNVRADMKTKPAPLLNPGTGQPMTAEELGAVFCEELVAQELNNDDRLIPIPEEIVSFYIRRSPGILREKAGAQRRDHRNGRRTVGHRSLHGLLLLRPRLQGVHGQGLL